MVVRVYGEEGSQLNTQADVVKSALAKVGGLSDLAIELPDQEPAVEVQVNLAAAQKVGLKPGDVRRQATTLISGLLVGSLYENQKVFEVVVWSDQDKRSSPMSVSELVLNTPNGDFVRLGDVADVKIAATPAVVKRVGVALCRCHRQCDRSQHRLGRRRDQGALKQITFPTEYHAEVVTDKATGYRDPEQLSALFDRSRDRRLPPAPGNLRLMDPGTLVHRGLSPRWPEAWWPC